jgi:hypothetical protein
LSEPQEQTEIIRLSPALAAAIGLNESIVLMQLQYLTVISDREIDGRKWAFNTLTALKEKYFPFLSVATLSRVIAELKERNLIKVENLNKAKFDRTQWFSVELENCLKLPGFYIFQFEKSKPSKRKKQPVKLEHGTPQNETTIQETQEEIQKETQDGKQHGGAVAKPIGKLKATAQEQADIRAVFEFWAVERKKRDPKLIVDSERWDKVLLRLREGYTVADLNLATVGIGFSPHHMGQNDKGTVYDDLTNICKSSVHVDRFKGLADQANGATEPRANGKPPPGKFTPKVEAGLQSQIDWAERKARQA